MGCPTATGDVCSHRFRHPFHGLGGDLQVGQQFHLLASVIERGALAADQCQHAADPRRQLGVFDVEGGVGGEPPLSAVEAPVISAEHFGGTQHGEDGFQPHVLKPSLTSSKAGKESGIEAPSSEYSTTLRVIAQKKKRSELPHPRRAPHSEWPLAALARRIEK
jgi:hypothetical protein